MASVTHNRQADGSLEAPAHMASVDKHTGDGGRGSRGARALSGDEHHVDPCTGCLRRACATSEPTGRPRKSLGRTSKVARDASKRPLYVPVQQTPRATAAAFDGTREHLDEWRAFWLALECLGVDVSQLRQKRRGVRPHNAGLCHHTQGRLRRSMLATLLLCSNSPLLDAA